MIKKNLKALFGEILAYTILLSGALLILLPFAWMLLTAVKPSPEVLLMPPKWWPSSFQWENFRVAFNTAPFGQYLRNSLLVSAGITLGELLTTILAAYAFVFIPFSCKRLLFAVLIATMMVPSEILVIPNYITLSNLGWINTYQALILPWCASVFSIFLLRQRFASIAKSYFHAARLDGANDLQFLCFVLLPMSLPTLVSIGVLKLIASWNAYMWPLMVTNSDTMRTLPIALAAFANETGVSYNTLMAFTLMALLPILIAYFIVQKYIIAGISDSGVKG